ncbi:MAG TPA: hypothetical protein VEY89_05345, partial [Candidatus Dormibacteraeota bacterium]|nr:hypothetical protein [Candidatus Dormibacteraeota bacterium]
MRTAPSRPPDWHARRQRTRRAGRMALTLLALGALLAFSAGSRATDWQASLDTRLVSSDAERSLMDGGFGTVRFGRNDEGLQLGRLRFELTQRFLELWSVHLDVSAWDDKGRSPAGVTEAYVQFRPYPREGLRFRLKAGAFYPTVSLENRAAGWESPYTLSFSAIESWLAVELRAIGIEGQLDWLGTRLSHDFDLSATAGAFGWNEAVGAELANVGFTFTDRQTPLFDRIGRRGVPPLSGEQPFVEYDGRAGVYAGLEARYLDRVVLRVLRYDNRADPSALDVVSGAIAWDTRFNSAGVRVELDGGWTAIAQWLGGETTIAPPGLQLDWPFRADFALLSKRLGRHTLSARYDRFRVRSNNEEIGGGSQDGHAWTAAYVFDASEHWRFTLEWLRVTSSSYN